MVVHSWGFAPQNIPTKEEKEEEKRFFLENLPVLLKHQKVVLENPKYFFSWPGSFAFGSWPYISGDGPVYTGHLLLGWQSGRLLERCTECGGSVYLVGVGGSPLSGSGSCWGPCLECGEFKRKYEKVLHMILSIMDLRRDNSIERSEGIEEDGFEPSDFKEMIAALNEINGPIC